MEINVKPLNKYIYERLSPMFVYVDACILMALHIGTGG